MSPTVGLFDLPAVMPPAEGGQQHELKTVGAADGASVGAKPATGDCQTQDSCSPGEANTVDNIEVEHKFTAALVENDCPGMLKDLAKHIVAHSEKARKCEEKADQHYTSIAQYLASAQAACDDGGFDAFRERFCPDLGRTRIYELLAIANNKKTVEEIKANTRGRVAKHRANKTVASVTVTEKPEPDAQEARAGNGGPDNSSLVPEDTPKPARSGKAATPGDEALRDFSARVMDLLRRIDKKPIGRFAGTSVPPENLARLGRLFTDLANLKKSDAAKPTLGLVPGSGLHGQLADDVTALHGATETVGDGSAASMRIRSEAPEHVRE